MNRRNFLGCIGLGAAGGMADMTGIAGSGLPHTSRPATVRVPTRNKKRAYPQNEFVRLDLIDRRFAYRLSELRHRLPEMSRGAIDVHVNGRTRPRHAARMRLLIGPAQIRVDEYRELLRRNGMTRIELSNNIGEVMADELAITLTDCIIEAALAASMSLPRKEYIRHPDSLRDLVSDSWQRIGSVRAFLSGSHSPLEDWYDTDQDMPSPDIQTVGCLRARNHCFSTARILSPIRTIPGFTINNAVDRDRRIMTEDGIMLGLSRSAVSVHIFSCPDIDIADMPNKDGEARLGVSKRVGVSVLVNGFRWRGPASEISVPITWREDRPRSDNAWASQANWLRAARVPPVSPSFFRTRYELSDHSTLLENQE